MSTSALQEATESFAKGHFQTSIDIVTKILQNNAHDIVALRLLSSSAYKQKNYLLAIQALEKVIQLNQANANDYFSIATMALAMNKYAQAEQVCLNGLQREPLDEKGLITLTNIYFKQNNLQKTKETVNILLNKHPDSTRGKFILACLNKDINGMLLYFKNCMSQDPFNSQTCLEVSTLLLELGRFKEADFYCAQLIVTGQNLWQAYLFLGQSAYFSHNRKQTETYFTKALAHSPDNPLIHIALARHYLIIGDLAKAWPRWAWNNRLKKNKTIQELYENKPQWRGEDLTNQHLLIYAEPNYANTLQFLRYIPLIKKYERLHITLIVSDALRDLVVKLELADAVITENQLIPQDINFHVSLLNIPCIKNFDYSTPLIFDLNLSPKLPGLNTLYKIGICWKQKTSMTSNWHSIDLEPLLIALTQFQIEVYSLQYGDITDAEHKLLQRYNVRNLPQTSTLESISSIENLDLVISIDHDLVHLAALLNKPTWVLLSAAASWVYGDEKNTMPWYPKIKLFRQTQLFKWATVITQLLIALDEKLPKKNNPTLHPYNIFSQKILDNYNKENYAECLKLCEQALIEIPNNPDIIFYMGAAAFQLNNQDLALTCLSHALTLSPKNINLINNLAALYYKKHDIEKALELFLSGLALYPNHADTLKNIAVCYFEKGNYTESIRFYQKSLEKEYKVDTHFSLSLAYLVSGNYMEGWPAYENRLGIMNHTYMEISKKLISPVWNGEDLNGKRLFILCEQGIGDNIQFVRFIKKIKQLFPEVVIILGCPIILLRLFKCLSDIDIFICERESILAHDYHLPIMGLPLRLGIFNESQFLCEPYLLAAPVLKSYWAQQITRQTKIKIGFCWSGSTRHIHNLRRNCQLSDFLFLQSYTNIELYSLQKELTAKEKELLTYSSIYNAGEVFNDMADTAALVDQLDIIISIDSAISHLAGALGKTVWLLLPYYTEWRHPHEATRSTWYQHMPYFRQSVPGDWKGVFQAVEIAIQKLIKEKS